MTLSAPFDILSDWPGWTLTFEPLWRQEQSRQANGVTRTKDFGSPLWSTSLTSKTNLTRPQLDHWRARLNRLLNGQETFYGYSLSRVWPMSDPGGKILKAGSPTPIGGVAALGDFTTGVYALDGVAAAQSDAISNTRASTATYVDSAGTIQTATNDVLRFDYDPVSHAARGILVEPTATNLFPFSENFSTGGGWTLARVTVTADQAVAPDGNTTADLITEDTNNGEHGVTKFTPTLTIGAAYLFSNFFRKNSTNRHAAIQIDGSAVASAIFVSYNLDTGALIGSSGPSTAVGIIAYPNGWYRLYVLFTATAAATARCIPLMYNSSAGAGSLWTGDGASNILFWGAQFEAASAGQTLPSSYIPTAASAVTRAADAPVLKAIGTNSWTAILDDGSSQSLGGATGNLSILPANLNRPHIKSYQATRLAQPAPSTVTINSLNVNNKAMSLAGLPPGYKLSVGDFVQVGDGDLYQIQEDVAAGATGRTPEFEVVPNIWPGTITGTTATIENPACLMTIVPGSVASPAAINGLGTITFQATESRG